MNIHRLKEYLNQSILQHEMDIAQGVRIFTPQVLFKSQPIQQSDLIPIKQKSEPDFVEEKSTSQVYSSPFVFQSQMTSKDNSPIEKSYPVLLDKLETTHDIFLIEKTKITAISEPELSDEFAQPFNSEGSSKSEMNLDSEHQRLSERQKQFEEALSKYSPQTADKGFDIQLSQAKCRQR